MRNSRVRQELEFHVGETIVTLKLDSPEEKSVFLTTEQVQTVIQEIETEIKFALEDARKGKR